MVLFQVLSMQPTHSFFVLPSDVKTNTKLKTLPFEIMPFAATWTDLEIITLSAVNQTKKDEYHMISLICGI